MKTKIRVPLFVAARSTNSKTGDVPTVWIGRSIEESRLSCTGCKLLEDHDCYAQYGTPRIGMTSIVKGVAIDARRYVVRAALRRRAKTARFLRLSALGDAARADRRQLRSVFREAAQAGLAVVGFTHFWKDDGAFLKGRLMASCDSFADAKEANRRGWRAAIFAPADMAGTVRRPDGTIDAVLCPAIAAQRLGKHYTCNECASGPRGALCDASRPGPNVYFPDHGQKQRAKSRASKRWLDVVAA